MLGEAQQLRVLLILALIQFSNVMDFMVIMPLGPQLMRLFQITPQQFSFIVSIYTFAAGICGFLGSMIFDRIDRKISLLGAYSGFLIGTLGCATANSYGIFLITRAVSGMFGGILAGICFAIVADLFPIDKRGYALGRVMVAYSLATIFGVPTGLYLANYFGWHAPFFAIAGLGVALWILGYFWIPTVKYHLLRANLSKRNPHVLDGFYHAMKDTNSRLSLLLTFCMVLSQFVVIPFIAPVITQNFGFKEINLPYLYFLGGLITTLSGPFFGKLCDRYGARAVFSRTGLLFLIPVFLMTHIPSGAVIVILTISTLFFVLSNSRLVPSMTMISSSISIDRRGSFLSLNSCVQQLSSSFAAIIGGFLISQSADGHLMGFNHTAYVATAFGIFAYVIGRRIRFVS